ncbi:hypothetical protein ACE4Z1_03995 [Enterococcus faecium]|uniref:hypothetical protein n=1 Tax=Enterococcus TaxID=1350 RepID=UPI000CF25F90|nr:MULTISPECIES: hypothetical protein [Enterococcus]MEB4737993.1 hypothetical protein [Enterococcus sp. E5-112]PQC68508.1 hypothetical protein CUN43_08340 [Enterococcus faecium]PQC73419.1 hypothetical protein CUN04_13515 [Enterococcus faecium]
MNWLLIHPFGYSRRTERLEEVLTEKKIEFSIVASNYSHTKKEKINYIEQEGKCIIPIKVIPYKKNISIKRIISHLFFSISTFLFIKKNKPKNVYCRIPPNLLLFLLVNFCKDTKVLVDVYDLWPESFPKKKNKIIEHLFDIWRCLRDSSLTKTQATVLECNLYKKYLPIKDEKKMFTIYPEALNNESFQVEISNLGFIDKEINFCYLGTINNIVNFAAMESIFDIIPANFSFSVHFMGKGEKKEKFADIVEKYGGKFVDHGPIYSDEEKNKIINRCHFGLNLFAENTIIGLSLKSIEYFKFGLPIISNLRGDTFDFIKSKGIGIDYSEIYSFYDLCNYYKEDHNVRLRVRKLYEEKFYSNTILNQWEKIIGGLFSE